MEGSASNQLGISFNSRDQFLAFMKNLSEDKFSNKAAYEVFIHMQKKNNALTWRDVKLGIGHMLKTDLSDMPHQTLRSSFQNIKKQRSSHLQHRTMSSLETFFGQTWTLPKYRIRPKRPPTLIYSMPLWSLLKKEGNLNPLLKLL